MGISLSEAGCFGYKLPLAGAYRGTALRGAILALVLPSHKRQIAASRVCRRASSIT